ncbi:DinB family protein [Salimicrobium halophilum]|uniref:DinB superfamily protein n=1 Tax=Salimicrobium halophilum TaxID=86666 RepID=A0A1G8WHQ3_9BACI|nr:DinB family protein [Salimicrobium halophilum]SDJ77686.1 DinB superfamily protein [Salimicrobium halophilum]
MDQSFIQTRKTLISLLKHLNDYELNTAKKSGGWTVAQVVEHLAVAEVNFLGLVEKAMKQKHIGHAEEKDFSILRDRSVKMKAQQEPSTVHRNAEDCIQMLQNSRKATEAFLNENKDIGRYVVSHPRFGDIPAYSIFTLIAEHERRHIEQIEEILEAIK